MMTTNSYPAAGTNGLTEAQWESIAAIGDGVVEDFGVGAAESFGITLNNATNEATISAGKARVGGYIGEAESATVVSVPAVGSTTVYTIAWCYDPSLNVADGGGARSALGPVRLDVYTGALSTTGGKRYLPLYVITRTASQVLTASARVDHRRWVGPLLTMPTKPSAESAGVLFPRGARLVETTTGYEYLRLPNAGGTALEWVNVTTPAKVAFPASSGFVSGPAILNAPPRVMREAGRVFGEGTIQRSTGVINNGNTVLLGTLPVGFRPIGQRFFTGWGSGGPVRLTVDAAGRVFMYDTGGVNQVYISLDCINFRAEG